MRRVFVIENPAASRSTSRGLETVLEVLRTEGCAVESALTEHHGHATALAAEAVRKGVDVVAVYGGDGTAMQAVAGMHGSDALLGLIPGGTGNLLSRNLRIPRDPARAARIIAHGVPRTIDLGRLETREGERFFAVGCGTGYDADMMAETTQEQKKRWGFAAYVGFVLRTAHRIRPTPITITVDGEKRDFDYVSVVISNCGEIIPPLLTLGPEVRFDDGILDVVVLKANGFLSAAWAVWHLLRMRESARVQRVRGKEIRVETPTPQVVQADGDICGTTPLSASLVPGGLRVLVRARLSR